MREYLTELETMPSAALTEKARGACRAMSGMEWELSATMLVMDRKRVHEEHGFGSMVRYAAERLDLHPQKASELLRAARALESLPLLSEAFRSGLLGWSKIRSLTRVADAATEGQWRDFARSATAEEIERETVVSPRRWHQEAQARESRSAAASQLGLLDERTHGPASSTSSGKAAVEERTDAERRTLRSEPPPAKKSIRVTWEFSADEWIELERAIKVVKAQHGRQMSPKQAILALCRERSGTSPERDAGRGPRKSPNTILLVHVDAGSQQAWIESAGHGRIPAGQDLVDDALRRGKVAVVTKTSAQAENAATVPTSDGTSPVNELLEETLLKIGHAVRRPDLTVPTIEALVVRARGRCERCGSTGPLHVDHIQPWSENPEHHFQGLQLLCGSCHVMKHRQDFEDRKTWREARERARKQRHDGRKSRRRNFQLESTESGSLASR